MKAFDNLLVIETFQSWGEYVVMDFAGQLKDLVMARYRDKPWAVLHDARKWELGTPETVKIVASFVSTPLTGTLTHHALVTGKSEIKKWQAEQYFQDVSHFETRLFDDIREATEWLLSKGYRNL